MTFLELAVKTARESGTFRGGRSITTVTGLTGREAMVVEWVQDAWQDIQTSRADWRWMQGEFSSTAVASGTQRYTPADLGITRFGHWRVDRDYDDDSGLSIFLTSKGQADERQLRFYRWSTGGPDQDFHDLYLRGQHATRTGYPQVVSIDPSDRLVLYPIPDAPYTIRGRYQKSPQTLAADADVPEMPAHHHQVIWSKALVSLGISEESQQQIGPWEQMYMRRFNDLVRDQSPRMRVGAPLA